MHQKYNYDVTIVKNSKQNMSIPLYLNISNSYMKWYLHICTINRNYILTTDLKQYRPLFLPNDDNIEDISCLL